MQPCGHGEYGVYWLAVYRRLEGFFELVVANAQPIKTVPGRKTDVQHAQWIADLLQHGLLSASFVPSQEQQDLRDLTRLRVSPVQERSRLVNRVQKVLEEAGFKHMVSMASDEHERREPIRRRYRILGNP